MKTTILAILLAMAGVGWGQQPHPDGLDIVRTACSAMEPATRTKTEACRYVDAKPAPLKCGKFEKLEKPARFCGDSVYADENGKLVSSCFKPYCAPIMHSVTEKEWVELMARLKKLEGR